MEPWLGDRMLSMPIICTVGYEANRCKEVHASEEEFPGWGDLEDRSVLWEAVTASGVLEVGASILVMRNPKAAALVQKHIAEMMDK